MDYRSRRPERTDTRLLTPDFSVLCNPSAGLAAGAGSSFPRSGTPVGVYQVVLRPRTRPWAFSFLNSSVYSPTTCPEMRSPVVPRGW